MTLKVPEVNPAATPDLRDRAMADPIGNPAQQSNKRRSTRVAIDFPVMVFGHNLNGKIFAEKTKTLAVNAHGALIELETKIDSQKPVYLENTKIGSEVQCRVVFQKDNKKDKFEVGLEFATPFARFWGMNFPPDDWNPADRKKVSSPHRPIPASTKGTTNK